MCFVCFPVTKLAFILIRCIVWCCKTFFSVPLWQTFPLMCGEGRQYYSMEIHVEAQIDAATFCLPPCLQEHGFLQERYLQNTSSERTQNSVKIFPFCQNRCLERRITPTSHAVLSNKPQPSSERGTPILRFCQGFQGHKTGLLGAFGTDILQTPKGSLLIIKAMPSKKRTAFLPASRTSAENKPFSDTRNSEKERHRQPGRLSHTAWLSFHLTIKIIVKTFGSIRKSANFVGVTLLTTA